MTQETRTRKIEKRATIARGKKKGITRDDLNYTATTDNTSDESLNPSPTASK